jgi:hypothetical protein
MKPRHGYRLIAKTRANAQAAGMAPTEWLGLTRKQRKARKRKAKEESKTGAEQAAKTAFFFARCEHGVQFLNQCDDCPDGCPVVEP